MSEGPPSIGGGPFALKEGSGNGIGELGSRIASGIWSGPVSGVVLGWRGHTGVRVQQDVGETEPRTYRR